ncbi:MAG: proline--tRNA ligase [Myxococcales bacterium]|nr:proline--tRNA ligase [Myxococcales bacterium]MCB9708988.1 proline--tRNA ligase [Myxococcales bacterium]
MRYSSAFIPTLKESPKDAQTPSHILLLRGGYIRMVGAGIYELLPLGLRVLERISRLVRDAMNNAGAQELLLPGLVPASYYQESGRYEGFGDILLRFPDRTGAPYVLAPTHEEVITDLARRELRSYKQLPVILYQIQTKYRDEPRPRAGLLRGREFLMKDAYSFDPDHASAEKSYASMRSAYHEIFTRMGLDFRVVTADSGSMGGSGSAEFQVLAATGEDAIVACKSCDYAANTEVTEAQKLKANDPCPTCGAPLAAYRGIEVGHIFMLGTHYSEKMGALFLDELGKHRPLVMGCYGIGISRLMAAAVEQHHDEHGIIWPLSLAPYEVIICRLGTEPAVREASETLYAALKTEGITVLLDDRDERPGVKFKDADLLGIPLRVTVGARALADGAVELKARGAKEASRIPVADVHRDLRAALGRAL